MYGLYSPSFKMFFKMAMIVLIICAVSVLLYPPVLSYSVRSLFGELVCNGVLFLVDMVTDKRFKRHNQSLGFLQNMS